MRKIALFATMLSLMIGLVPTAFAQGNVECPSPDAIRAVNFDIGARVPWIDYAFTIDQNHFRTDQQWSFKLLLLRVQDDATARQKALSYMPDLILSQGPEATKNGTLVCRYTIKNQNDAFGYAETPESV